MSFSAPFPSVFARVRFSGCAAVVCLCSAALVAQVPPASGDYTQGLPSVQRIESEIKGTDATDTLARQIAVFEYLQSYIGNIKYARTVRGPYTPGEQKILTEYAKAQNDLTQSYTKTHTAAEVADFNRLEGRYELNNAWGWVKPLLGRQVTDTYAGAEKTLGESYQRNQDRIQNGLNPPQRGGLANDPVLDPQGIFARGQQRMENDPAVRRCLELGGTVEDCEGGVLGAVANGLAALVGSMVGVSESSDEPLNGVLLVGKYHSRTALPELELTQAGQALLTQCGTLVGVVHNYTMRKSAAATQIVMENEPDPIVLTLRSDGSLSGPGRIPVKGQIIIGTHNEYSCHNGACNTTSTPIYSPSMQRCTVSELAPLPPPPPAAKPTGMVGQLMSEMGADAPPPLYGFRVSGAYVSSTGMLLSFGNRHVTVDCGKAHVNAPYTVDNTAAGFVIHVQNGGGAFLLGVAPDNTLRGSGSTTVNGRLVTALHGQDVSFAPHSESCALGTFAPKGKQNTMRASDGPMPVVPASYSARPPAPEDAGGSAASAPRAPGASGPIGSSLAAAGITPDTSGARAQFRVLLSAKFNGANPLAGQAVFVTRKPMDEILRELGVAVPANATPGQAMKALQTKCHSAQGCSSVIQGLPKYYVTTTKLDGSGKATLSATADTGRYYFFAIVPEAGGSLVWDVPANLAAGDNNVAFSQTNAERLP